MESEQRPPVGSVAPRSNVRSLIVVVGLVAFGVEASSLSALAQTSSQTSIVKTVDLKAGGAVTSVATRADGRGYVASFAQCTLAVFDKEVAPQSQQKVAGCEHIFTVHMGLFDGAEAAAASSYTGYSVVLSSGKITKYKTHDAAVTEAFLTAGGLLSSSDDGSVVFSSLDGKTAARTLVTGQGVARFMAPYASKDPKTPAFFIGFDSGGVMSVDGAEKRTYQPGVGRINGLARSSDGRTLFIGGFDGRVRRIDLASGEVKDVFSAGVEVNNITLDEKSGRLGVVSDSGRLVIIDTASGKTVADMPASGAALTAVALAEGGGQALAGDAAGVLYLIDLPGTPTTTPK